MALEWPDRSAESRQFWLADWPALERFVSDLGADLTGAIDRARRPHRAGPSHEPPGGRERVFDPVSRREQKLATESSVRSIARRGPRGPDGAEATRSRERVLDACMAVVAARRRERTARDWAMARATQVECATLTRALESQCANAATVTSRPRRAPSPTEALERTPRGSQRRQRTLSDGLRGLPARARTLRTRREGRRRGVGPHARLGVDFASDPRPQPAVRGAEKQVATQPPAQRSNAEEPCPGRATSAQRSARRVSHPSRKRSPHGDASATRSAAVPPRRALRNPLAWMHAQPTASRPSEHFTVRLVLTVIR